MSLMGLIFGDTAEPIKLYYGFANSMQKEFNRADDGTILSEKHTFNIRGAMVPEPMGTNKIIPSGAFDRYTSLVGTTSQYYLTQDSNDFIVGRLGDLRSGPLKLVRLVPDDANPGHFIPSGIPVLEYKYAQLNNVGINEAPEDTAGIHFQEITMSFEAITPPSNDPNLENMFRLKAAAEQFEIKKEEDKLSYFVFNRSNGTMTNDYSMPYYSYTITHTISAQGIPIFYNNTVANENAIQNNSPTYDYDPSSGLYNYANMIKPSSKSAPSASDGISKYPKFEAFYEAYNYVQRKKKDSLLGGIIYTDIHGRSYLGSNAFMPTAWAVVADDTLIPSTAAGVSNGVVQTNGPNGLPLHVDQSAYETYLDNKYGLAARASGIRPIPNSGTMISQNLWDSGVYGEYNVVRTSTVDMVAGSYSLTTTYFYSRSPANIEINGSYEKGEDGNDVIKIEGTINGLDSRGVKSDISNKYVNARDMFSQLCYSGIQTTPATTHFNPTDFTTIQDLNTSGVPSYSQGLIVDSSGWPLNDPQGAPSGISPYGNAGITFAPWGIGTNIFTFANKIFEDNTYTPFYNSNMVLDIRPAATTITENKIAGTIQFSATYKPIPKSLRDIKLKIPNCIAATLNIQDDNRYRKTSAAQIPNHKKYTVDALASGVQSQHIVPVMVLGRKTGPILQNMSTTKQSERKVQLEATVDVVERYPDSLCVVSGIAVVLDHYPPNTANFYLNELQETWDWANGKLTINAGWIYTR